jgi:hypothetical protein
MERTQLISIVAAIQLGCCGGVMSAMEPGSSTILETRHYDQQQVLNVFEIPVIIPDNDPEGIVLGEIKLGGDEEPIQDIVLSMNLKHDYLGDLSFSLYYDFDHDGIFDAVTPIDFHLARLDPCCGEELYACPAELDGFYYFKDEGWEETGEESSFTVFKDLPGGGSFYLAVVDRMEDNTGTVRSWAVYRDDFEDCKTIQIHTVASDKLEFSYEFEEVGQID